MTCGIRVVRMRYTEEDRKTEGWRNRGRENRRVQRERERTKERERDR